jgi:hypothetical protein
MSNLNGFSGLSPKLASKDASQIEMVGKRRSAEGLIAIGFPTKFNEF